MDLEVLRRIVEIAIEEMFNENVISFRPVVGPIKQLDGERRFRIQFLDSPLQDITVKLQPGWSYRRLIQKEIIKKLSS